MKLTKIKTMYAIDESDSEIGIWKDGNMDLSDVFKAIDDPENMAVEDIKSLIIILETILETVERESTTDNLDEDVNE